MEIDNPFDGEADRRVRENGLSLQAARDAVVKRFLLLGGTEALAHWLQTDYQPGPEVRQLLSRMLQPTRFDADHSSRSYNFDLKKIPYELVSKRRDGKGGRREDPIAHEKNTAIRDYYERRRAELGPGSFESIVAELSDMDGLEEGMVREALKKRSPKTR